MGKNLQKVQDMLDGNFKTKTQVGYSKTEEHRKVGDKWVDEDGIEWEQKDGFQVKGRLSTHPDWDKKCSICDSLIIKPWDRDTYKADGRCYHCQLNYELDLKFDKPIRWFAYRRLKDFKNMKSIEKDMEQWIDEKQELIVQLNKDLEFAKERVSMFESLINYDTSQRTILKVFKNIASAVFRSSVFLYPDSCIIVDTNSES